MTLLNQHQKIEGFGGELLHPSLDIKDNILILGFRYRATADGEKEIFLLVRNGNIEILDGDTFENDKVRYFIEKRKRKLARLEDRWGLSELKKFLEEHSNLAHDAFFNPKNFFEDIIASLKSFVELEKEIDYVLVAAWIIGTYFYPIFPAYPFLNPKGPKRSGKSQFLTLLSQLCFNAIKARPSTAALGDTVDALRGTYLIDQADSLERKGGEDLLDILADSYKRSGGKRRIIEFDKNKHRDVVEYETYGPKAFASIRELPEDLRDRCLIIPILRSQKSFYDPDDGSEMWKTMRGKLYRLLIDQYISVYAAYILQRAEYKKNGDLLGRQLELWLPLETILHCVGYRNITEEARTRFLSWYCFAEYEPSELEEAIVKTILDQFENQATDEITLSPKEIAGQIDNTHFHANDTPAQMAAKVGWGIKKFNLASQKLARTGKGNSYRFQREKVETIYRSYFSASEPAQPTQVPDKQENAATDEMNASDVGANKCRDDLHASEHALQTYTENSPEFSCEKNAV